MPEMIPDPANTHPQPEHRRRYLCGNICPAITASIAEALRNEAPWGHVDLEAEDPTDRKVSLPFGTDGNDVHFSMSVAAPVREFLGDLPPVDTARARDSYFAVARPYTRRVPR